MSRAIVVVPCYNEAKRLNLPAIQEFARGSDAADLLFVNDGSRDETLELIEHLNQSNPRRFSFLHLANNGGKAEAVRQGFLLALRSGADYVGFWDADLAAPLSDIEPFCRVLDHKGDIEVVVGTRMRLLGHKIERPALRYWLGRLFANTASLALGVRMFDTQCGAKLFRVTAGLEQLFERPFLTRWIFDVEILARMQLRRRHTNQPRLRDSIYEFPLDAWRDVAGSSVKTGDFFKATIEMAKIYWTYLRPGARPAAAATSRPPADAPSESPRPDQQQAA
ncbi:MAG: glycosyltransferase [Planctomycetia bacterium]|nr:glycosyltransferase [Planctomycetia bacterium]